MFDLSAHRLGDVATNFQESLDDEGTVDLCPSSDDDASLQLSDDHQEGGSWSALESIILAKGADSAEEENLPCNNLWDEDAAGYDTSASESLACDVTFTSSQSTLLDQLDLDDEVYWQSSHPITAPSETRPGSSQQGSEADDELTVRLSHTGFLRVVRADNL